MQCRQDTPFPGDVTVLDRLLDRQAFEFDAKPDDFGEIISRDRGDAVAALVDQGDKPSFSRRQRASRSGLRLTPNAVRSRSRLSLLPGSNSPRMIASRRRATSAVERVADAGTARVRASLMVCSGYRLEAIKQSGVIDQGELS